MPQSSDLSFPISSPSYPASLGSSSWRGAPRGAGSQRSSQKAVPSEGRKRGGPVPCSNSYLPTPTLPPGVYEHHHPGGSYTTLQPVWRGKRTLTLAIVGEWTVAIRSMSKYSSVQISSVTQSCLFATPWTVACQASLSITNSWSLLKLISIKSVMPSNHLILCCPLLLLPSIFQI